MTDRQRLTAHPLITLSLLGLIVLGAALRLHAIGERSLWLDEAVIVQIAQGPLRDILSANASINSAPPTFPLMVAGMRALGEGETVLRLLSAGASVLSIPALFALTRALFDDRAALLASFLFTVSAYHIAYAQELREYALTFLLATCMLWAAVRVMRHPRPRDWAVLALAFAAGVWVQYGLALLALALNLSIAVMLIRRGGLRPQVGWWAASQVAVGVAALGVIGVALGAQFQSGGFAGGGYLAASYWDGQVGSLLPLVGYQTFTLFRSAFAGPALLILFSGLGLVASWQQDGVLVAMVGAAFGLAIAAALVRLYPYAGANARQSIYLMPLIYAAAGGGLTFIRQRWQAPPNALTTALLIIALSVPAADGLVSYYASEPIEHMRPAIALMEAEMQPGDQIYVGCRAAYAFAYYYKGDPAQVTTAHLPASAPAAERLWLLYSHCGGPPPADDLSRAAQYGTLTLRVTSPGLWLFQVEPPPPD